MKFQIGNDRVRLCDVLDFTFYRRAFAEVGVTPECLAKTAAAAGLLRAHLARNVPIYGVTTGFGDSNRNTLAAAQSEELQRNLVSYLLCGTGRLMPRPAVRAMCLARTVSLSRGHSGVTPELLGQLCALLAHDLMPNVPCEGSLGASGDLVPLAYLAEVVQGEGSVSTPAGVKPTAAAFRQLGLAPHALRPKEGLALVNGTSAMVGMAVLNHAQAALVAELAQCSTAWLCLATAGRPEAFGVLVNEKAKLHCGQRAAAQNIRRLLAAEGYRGGGGGGPAAAGGGTLDQPVQDRYSLRCAPQILGPVLDTLATFAAWLELEINSVSDNPLFDAETQEMAMGGNFYGGYLGHGMDYVKICLANVADLLDRQLMLIFDPKTAAGLPPNLAAWGTMPAEERHLHHGLKGLHQVTSALTSEICAMSMPSTVFSRSSECHNQDKVSLGMSAAMACHHMLEKTFTVCALVLTCLAQALELKGIELAGAESAPVYALVRRFVPFVRRDQALGAEIAGLTEALKELAHRRGTIFCAPSPVVSDS